ncbi:uncharacterized protein [Drosophila tropicalis]|uniref:uncharacterized protein n=1 Tax=Drosophila tropicalis TaxID=46794 RepID=UPI0035AB90F8
MTERTPPYKSKSQKTPRKTRIAVAVEPASAEKAPFLPPKNQRQKPKEERKKQIDTVPETVIDTVPETVIETVTDTVIETASEEITEAETETALDLMNKIETVETEQAMANAAEMQSQLQQMMQLLTLKIQVDEQRESQVHMASNCLENIVGEFKGSGPRKWFEVFEYNADAFELNEKQMYAQARGKMKGAAKLFLESVSVNNYANLKSCLIEEFECELSSAEVHQLLRERKKHKQESIQEYILSMRKIASDGDVEESAVLRYIVDNLFLKNEFKVGLYACKTFKELKEAYEIVDKLAKNDPRSIFKTTTDKFIIVPDEAVECNALIGFDFVEKFTVTYADGEYTFSKGDAVGDSDKECIAGSYNVFEVASVYEAPTIYQKAVRELIESIEEQPKQTQMECPVKLQIIPDATTMKSFHQSPSRLSACEAEAVKNQVDEWLTQGIVRKSTSSVASRVVVVQKKDGTPRICIDYRKLNSMSLSDRFPVPLIEEVLEKLQAATFYSVLDLENGFFHVPVEESSKYLTAFVTKEGLIEFNKTPFGFKNSPAAFIRFANYVFQNLINDNIMQLYMDDIIVYAHSAEDCLEKTQKKLKELLTSEPLLHLYSRDAPTELHTDASKHGFGAMLLQSFEDKLYPVYFWSKKTTESEAQRHSYILEAKAMYLALRKFRHYLIGIHFKLVTDCSAFKQTTKKEDVPREVTSYVLYLQDFTCDIIHKPGKSMLHVDHLSRYPQSIYNISTEVSARIKKAQSIDNHIKAVITILNQQSYENYRIKGGVLYKAIDGNDLIVVPKQMENEIIREAHEIGHFATRKTMHAICQQYWIPHLEQFVAENKVEHILTTTGVARGNGQIERVNRSILAVISKLSAEESSKWYKYVPQVQKALNSQVHASTKVSPFELMFGTKMCAQAGDRVLCLINEEFINNFNAERESLRDEAKKNILEAQMTSWSL